MKILICGLVLAIVSPLDMGHGTKIELSAAKIEGRITNGNLARDGQFPYQVGLELFFNDREPQWCGGSLIGTRWVLTAAHCTDGVQYLYVQLGTLNRFAPVLNFTISNNNVIVHSGYNRNTDTFANDISLIKIPSVSLSSQIQIIKLPSVAASYYSSYAGDYAIASGWGQTSDEEEFATDKLQWARMKVMSNRECRQNFYFLKPCSLCVYTSGDVSTCFGDSGGPLVLESNGVLIGLSSFVDARGCTKGYPAAFTRVTSYLGWIFFHTGILYL